MNVADLLEDLERETAALDTVLVPLDAVSWSRPTPAPGWSVRDQVTHLAHFDEVTVLAVTAPDAFASGRNEALADIDMFTEAVAARYRSMPGADVLAWFRQARGQLVEVLSGVSPSTRVPWYGPDMSLTTAVTARIMETWAHGQDVVDALRARRAATPALRHVAHLGVRTLANSFVSRGLDVPATPVHVELAGPDGERWLWGDANARDSVRGPALDFCLVVTQRRHVDDTDLSITGPVATAWMGIAQAFAGPPGAGRVPGQFGERRR